MKKVFLMSLTLIFTQVSFAQSLFDRFHFGLRAGANYSDFLNTNFSTEGLIGFHAGLIVNFKLTEQLSIQEEFLFSTQGANTKETLLGNEDLQLNYISVPILLKYKTPLGIFLEGGPQIGLLASDAKNTPFKEFANKIDGGVTAGFGYELKNGLGIGARYYYGLRKVGIFDSATIKSNFTNDMIQASLFYIF